MACELDDDEVMRLLEEINSDDSEIEDNIIENFEEKDSDADPDYYPPAIQDEHITEVIINIQNEGNKKKPVKNKGKKSTTPSHANTRETELLISSRFFFENDNVVEKNGFNWKSKCNLIPSTSKTSSKNIVHITPDPLGFAIFSNEPVEWILLFLSFDLLTKIISHINEPIVLQK
ncbi:uncharacterized protein LOC132952229 [Metopolophium dirhodum]|uniref:uncharacterized protein LOC132952229 n=1 Tax=Metopolophium dirhodum TaxID=44670 RepID=UPI00298FA39C|nr:uncharacterized protein LOC132952229 [Metopolophium dirhodum]